MTKFIKRNIAIIGRLNPLDWLIILLIIGGAVFLAVSSINRDKWVTIEFKVTLSPVYSFGVPDSPPSWLTEKIAIGDVQYDSLGQKNLEIKNIRSWGWGYRQTWVTASVKAKYKPSQLKYTFQYQPLEVGRAIDVTINGTQIHGVVTSVEGSSDTRPRYDIVVDARLLQYDGFQRGVEVWIADAFEQGEAMKDISGITLAEVLKKEVRPAERIITTDNGSVFLGLDPLRKDVFLTLKLRVTKDNDTYFFLEDYPIKVGIGLPIFLDRTQIGPIITHIDFPKDDTQ